MNADKLLSLALLLVFARTQAHLHAETVGATHLLSRGPGAAAASLGSSITPTVQDPTALYWNPAGLAFSGGAVTGEHLFLYDGARYNFLGLSVPSRLATFGLGALQLRRGNIIARSRIDDPGHEVSNTQTAYILGAARALGEHWAIGGTANVLDFDIAGFRGRGYGMDLALQGRFAGRSETSGGTGSGTTRSSARSGTPLYAYSSFGQAISGKPAVKSAPLEQFEA